MPASMRIYSPSIDWDRVEYWCRTQIEREGPHYLQPQALIALLLAGASAQALSAADYIVLPSFAEGRAPTAVLHHYVGAFEKVVLPARLAPRPGAPTAARMSPSEPTVSVLIPGYNAAPYVGATLESVLGQTWRRLEAIVVDDGSTDESAAILAGYLGRGVRVIRQQHAGAAAARNRALAASFRPTHPVLRCGRSDQPRAHFEPSCIYRQRTAHASPSANGIASRCPRTKRDSRTAPRYCDAPGVAWLAARMGGSRGDDPMRHVPDPPPESLHRRAAGTSASR